MFGYIDVDKEITGNYGEDSCGEEVVACTCDECNEPIFVGDKYYEIADIVVCENCIEEFARTGEEKSNEHIRNRQRNVFFN